MNRKNRLKKIQKTQPDPYTLIHDKFKRVAELRVEISKMKDKYKEYSCLMKELIPYFVKKENDRFIILRKLIFGTRAYNIHTYFYDEKEDVFLDKAWKSVAHETFSVEELPSSLI